MSSLALNVYIHKNKKHNQKNVCFFGLPNHILRSDSGQERVFNRSLPENQHTSYGTQDKKIGHKRSLPV